MLFQYDVSVEKTQKIFTRVESLKIASGPLLFKKP